MNRIQNLVCAASCFAAILGSASSAHSQSCAGSTDKPLTKTRLNQIAAIQGIPFRRIGDAFENFALSTINQINLFQKIRENFLQMIEGQLQTEDLQMLYLMECAH